MRITHPLAVRAAAAAMLSMPAVASATLIIEPVFLSTEGSGPAETVLGFYLPDFINPATGEPFLTADEPGEVVTYPAGFPRDEGLAEVVRFYNNTGFDITGFTLVLAGTAIEPEPFNFTVQRDPNVDAVWGDANGDGLIGLSDIFATVTVSEDGRTITFSDGYPSMPPTQANYQLLEVLSQVSQGVGTGPVEPFDPSQRGAADISFVADHIEAGLDGLGPDGSGSHTVEETVNLRSLERAAKRAAVLIHRLTRGGVTISEDR